ncbi:MAG: hypothetical protein HZC42_10275 [Candidatus Eisenbacteria bacterium]|nr:hypothetical protein [Candidatus Eisenbacteria bacterium]
MRVVLCASVLALPEVSQLHGGDAALRGLPGVAVVAESTSGDVRRYGIDEDWLAGRVRGALERAGVPLLERSDALTTGRSPLLVVRLQTVRVPDAPIIAWHLSLAMHQRVAPLGADSTRTLAQTWAAEASLGVTTARLLRASVAKTLDSQVEEFVQAWKGAGASGP